MPRRLILALLLACVVPSVSWASASRVGATFNASGGTPWGSKRVDVAYDPVHDVYLVVSGPAVAPPAGVYGSFVSSDGVVIGGPFPLTQTGAQTQMPRVTYSADTGGFLVVWQDLRVNPLGQVWGRFVQFQAGGQPLFTTNDFFIATPTGGISSELPPVAACAAGQSECLVGWQQFGAINWDIHAVRINLAGQRVGAEYALTADNAWDKDPSIAYNPASGIYLVAHSVYTTFGEIWIHRIKAGTGEYVGGAPIQLATGGALYLPEITVDAATQQFFVAWFDQVSTTYSGRFVNADGTPSGNVIPLLSGTGANDMLGLSYNIVSGTFFVVAGGNLSTEDIGFQVSAAGVPDAPFTVTASGSSGNYYPRIAANTGRAEWLAVASSGFTYVAGQRIGSSDRTNGQPPPPPTQIDLSPADLPNGSWFLAEGAANGSANGFKTYYEIQNSNPVDVSVRGYFADEAGNATMKMFTVPKQSRITVSLMEQVGGGSFGSVFQSLSTDASCPGGHCDIDVERSIYWGPNLEGSTDATAVKNLSTTWYFAEGSRGGELFNNYFMLFNPTQSTATVTGSYLRADGQVVARSYAVGPQQRLTIDANAINRDANTPVGLEGVDFSATFASNVPIVAERSMYWGYTPNNGWIGGHGTMGAPALNWFWAFAEGNAAPNFDTFYEIMNPNPYPILVNATFMTEYSGNISQQYAVGANSRFTVPMNVFFGNIGPMGAAFSSTDGGFLAERSIYWGNRVEGTNTIGSPGIAAEWHLPEGASGGMFDTFLMLLNPTNTPVTIDMTLYVEGIGQITLPETMRPVLQPTSRLTLNMKDVLHELEPLVGIPLVGHSFSTRVKVFGAGQIVAEHAIYWNFVDGQTYWRSGGASMGIPH